MAYADFFASAVLVLAFGAGFVAANFSTEAFFAFAVAADGFATGVSTRLMTVLCPGGHAEMGIAEQHACVSVSTVCLKVE